MTIVCSSCGRLVPGSLHTANGWICNPCERSASTIVVVYVINGRKFHKVLKGVEVPKHEAPAAVTTGASSMKGA